MNSLSIFLIVLIGMVIATISGYILYKRAKNEKTSECSSCHLNGEKLIKQYHKKYCQRTKIK